MLSHTVLISVLLAVADARFGQEQAAQAAIGAVTSGGQPGQAATLAGASIGTLLAAADPCAKLSLADQIISELGTGADAVKAAQGLVSAEQNFNPFVVSIPAICSNTTLPKTEILRGIVPLVDPAVGGSGTENANSAKSLKAPFSSNGMSVAQVMAANGFSNFTTKASDGTAGAAPAGGNGGGNKAQASAPAKAAPSKASCNQVVTTFTTVYSSATAAPAAAQQANGSGASNGGAAGVNPGFKASSISGLDFGLCTPTMKFEAGLDNRKDTEFTFQAIDPLVNKGQEEALNPNIITNRICDQLTNVCNANAAAKAACIAAKAKIAALGTKDVTTANAWNTELGFAGTDTNPDNAPQAGLIGHD